PTACFSVTAGLQAELARLAAQLVLKNMPFPFSVLGQHGEKCRLQVIYTYSKWHGEIFVKKTYV
ncbi:MAG: hypothetical protein KDK65_05380, partial [Chlamydiia bacterium]|nr:hypothetical protein [Chlamydiia bacterium]